jgi:hypothetical protein
LIIGNLSGIGLSANVRYLFMQFETNAAKYFEKENSGFGDSPLTVPEFSFSVVFTSEGIYLKTTWI